jgi:Mlc titration factor MtfA (ptsG expression regulator)
MGWLRNWRRRRLLAHHRIDGALWQSVTQSLPFLRGLSPQEMQRLREQSLLLLVEKEFSGTHGLVPDDAMRLSIAVQACLPVMNLGLDRYDEWSEIVVHPGDFKVRVSQTDDHGVVHEFDDERAGESWPGGPVVLSWDAAANAPEMNVVVHEFAHKLDMANGEADGNPPLHSGMDRRAWAQAFRVAYEGFCDVVDREKETWLDPYAAEAPAEFFAVISEAFFEAPNETRRRYPDVYEQLRLFYRQDPASRLPS